ncbi:efflux transporter outer membrane subunit [Novosphingobium pentaromativorans]|uniref:Outer membrane multidrug efflux protein n=1 Tax=Novosphingobium pentaromativorans US6-1 TaxID=1088721 RepID=G6EIW4_9SPHN|nr:efflux transporter outer membrane subunit [Novosphingobium pentaromativorans]AIT78925.1 RND transporter [Novosphingobium pentaromativorans US6-1]EHJ58723.1 outer membrane multidrug efflux protein [Novosphingobium pentaromativorans US6-1]
MRRCLPSFAALLLAGCATAGPDYAPPSNSAATMESAQHAFVSAGDGAFSLQPLPERWWRLYDDPVLDGLVEEALTANADLRAADANLKRAEAVVRGAVANRALSTGISGGASLARPSSTGYSLPGVVDYDAGISLALPLDLRGKIARAIEASEADRDAVAAARDAVRVSVAAATAQAYADVCGANFRLAATKRIVALQRQTLDATRRLEKGGRGTAFDVSRAQAQVDASEAKLPGFVAQRRSALYLLATLLGRAPSDYPAAVEQCDSLPTLASAMPVGDGAALIRRRPDIRQAERTIAADTARIGVATADLYPQISLGGSLGVSGPVKDIGGPTSFGFSLGPLISWSFPNRPVVRAAIDRANAQVEADLAGFDSTVLSALRETETALETYARNRETTAALGRARESAALSAQQAGKLFRFGRSDFLTLLDSQRSLAEAEASYANARAGLVDDQIAVFLALGGGWE